MVTGFHRLPFRSASPQARDPLRIRRGRVGSRSGGPGRGGAGHHRRADHAHTAEESRDRDQGEGDRPHRPHPRDFRRAGGDRGRTAPGVELAQQVFDDLRPGRLVRSWGSTHSRAPARRLRLPRRPGRNPDRGRPSADPRPDGEAQEGAGAGHADPGAAPRPPPARAVAGRSPWSATPMPASRPCSTG